MSATPEEILAHAAERGQRMNLRYAGAVTPGEAQALREAGAAVASFLDKIKASFDPSQKLLFLCRSGVRSHYAAEVAAGAGYHHAYNILEGFEGEHGAGTNGWRTAGLPWERG